MVFGLFSKEKALQRLVEKALNKLSQQPDRWGALERLRDDGSEDALYGLCRRFSIQSMKGVEDEQEKNWVVDTLVAKDQQAFAPLVRYMKAAEQLAFPLRVFEQIANRDKALPVVDELFAGEKPGYVRMPERRIDLLHWYAEWDEANDEDVVTHLTPYLVDFDENVRFTAITGMNGCAAELIAKPLIDALVRPEEESGRIRRTIIEVLAESKVPLGDRGDEVAGRMQGQAADEYKIAGGFVVKR
jgi:hypothetical protein